MLHSREGRAGSAGPAVHLPRGARYPSPVPCPLRVLAKQVQAARHRAREALIFLPSTSISIMPRCEPSTVPVLFALASLIRSPGCRSGIVAEAVWCSNSAGCSFRARASTSEAAFRTSACSSAAARESSRSFRRREDSTSLASSFAFAWIARALSLRCPEQGLCLDPFLFCRRCGPVQAVPALMRADGYRPPPV